MKNEETWKSISGYEGYYEASDKGRVRSLPHKELVISRHGTPFLRQYRGRIIKGSLGTSGYWTIIMSVRAERESRMVHRLIAETFLVLDASRPCVNHKDGNKLNNEVINLEWCTYHENVLHAQGLGTYLWGSSHPLSKLTNSQVLEILDLAKSRGGLRWAKPTYAEIGQRFGVCRKTVSKIVHGKTYCKETGL